jgi:nitrite reductase/ring-hydroxylating ferredoxin subunit
MASHVVAKVGEIGDGEGRVVTAGGRQLAVFNAGGTFRVLDNACPHRGGPLGEGAVDGGIVTCPWHGWQYDLATGVACHRADVKVATFPVRVDGDAVTVELP